MCVCVCVCVYIYIILHRHCFLASQLFSVARHVICFMLGPNPG